jgi:hypothetical protein
LIIFISVGAATVSSGITETRNYDLQDNLLENFLRGIGTSVIRLDTGIWQSMDFRVFQPVRMNGPMDVSESTRKALWDRGSLFLRYPAPPDSFGIPSFIHLLDDKNYDLETLASSQRRRDIRRSFKLCVVGQIPIKELVGIGLELIPDTMLRQGLHWEPKITKQWEKYFLLASENPLFEAWAAFDGNRLGAYRVDMSYRGGYFAQVIFNRADSLRFKVMDAMTFVSTREVIQRPEVEFISMGIRGRFAHIPSLEKFKESMGYKRLEIRERVEVCPKLKPFFQSNFVNGLVAKTIRKYWGNSHSAKSFAWAIESLRPGTGSGN